MAARHPYHRGDVVLIQFPFSDALGQKERPAVVLSTDVYHDEWDELLLVGLTSVPPKTQRPTDYKRQDWRAAGVQQPSWMRSHVATAHRRLVIRKLGALTLRDLQVVEVCLRTASGL